MKRLLLLPLLIQLCFALSAQTIINDHTQQPGVDYARLRRIDTLVNAYVQQGWIHDAVTIVVKDNHIIQYQGYGTLDRNGRKPMPADALFRIASQTKAIVSAGIMTLYEEGKFYLDEPIADFIPEFRHPVVLDQFHGADTTYTTHAAKREITFRDLLTHTSGIDYPDIGSPSMKAIYAKAGLHSGLGVVNMDLLQAVKTLAKLPLAHEPGEKWTYGLSVDVIGCLVEVISGKNLEEYLQEKLFRPMGMKDTYFNVPADRANRLSIVYTEDADHKLKVYDKSISGIDPDYPILPKHYFSGGAGLTSTAYDYAIFLQMMLNKGKYNGKQILAPRTVELMTSGQLDFLYNGSNNFGLGFDITSAKTAAREPRNEGSFAWGGYFGTTYWADPKARLVCLIMTQQIPNSHGDLATKFEQLVYQSLR